MVSLINFCFNDGDKEFIGITRYGAIGTNIQEKYTLSLNKTYLKLATNYLPDNSHFSLGSMCFCQLTEIHTESDPAPLLQNYFYTVIKERDFFR